MQNLTNQSIPLCLKINLSKQPAWPVNNVKVGDFVKVIKADYYRYYVVATGESYGAEIEISYFLKREKNFAIKENDFDSRLTIELKRGQRNLVG